MSTIGYSGRSMFVKRGGVVIAAVQSKTAAHAREPVDVTTDDADGWRKLLPEPGARNMNISVEGVATSDNFSWMRTAWLGNVHSDITLEYPDGEEASAADGFALASLEFSGEQDGHVAFTAEFQSSGEVTLTTVT